MNIPHDEWTTVTVNPDRPSEWDEIQYCTPAHELVYLLYNAAGELIYVGITWNAGVRWRKHKRTKPWWNEVARAELTCCHSDNLALEVELFLIRSQRPVYNIRGVRK